MKAVLFILPVLILAGLVFGGVIHIPGMNDPPKKHSKKKGDDKSEKTDAPPETPKPVAKKDSPKVVEKPKKIEPTLDAKKGAQALAMVWNEMDVKDLSPIVAQWKDEELTPVLAVMDNAKVVEVLSKMKPERASLLSKNLQKLASIVLDPNATK